MRKTHEDCEKHKSSWTSISCIEELDIGLQRFRPWNVFFFFYINNIYFQNLERVMTNGLLAALHLHTYTIYGSQLLFCDFEILKEVTPASSLSTDIIHARGANTDSTVG